MSGRRLRRDPFVLNLWMSLFVLYLFAPLLGLALAAFGFSTGTSIADGNGFSLRGFFALAHDGALRGDLLVSAEIALLATPAALALGLAGALVLRALSARSANLLLALLLVPLALPALVGDLGSRDLWRGGGALGEILATALARTTIATAWVMLVFLHRLEDLDPTAEETAGDLGASTRLVFRRILLPRLAPALPAAAVIAFLLALRDPAATSLVLGAGHHVAAAGVVVLVAAVLLATLAALATPADRNRSASGIETAGRGIDT